ncbi:MAG TPA: PQQ-dependent sugar dehydrogenase [Verrucomicrobiae bacterium]|nr:PQQ-dependent sugar dehydrogenase [Verrucomicrobiae bacterium]
MTLRAGLAAVLITASTFAQTNPLNAYRDVAMGREGNATRGKVIFNDESRAACSKCHSTDASSSKAGPDLYAVGDKFPRRDLIQAILEPSAAIAVGYGATTVELNDGTELTGIIKQSTDEFLDLAIADGQKIRVAIKSVKSQRGNTLSLMPDGLQQTLSREEFGDLIEYLTLLKQPENALTANAGMPSVIPELAKPVELLPFFNEELRFPHAWVHKPGDVRVGLVCFGQYPGISNVFVAVHQTGKIWLLEKHEGTNGDNKTLFADFGSEIFNQRGPNGLLGLAFHPKFRENRKYYLKHQVFEEGKIATTLVEKIAAPDGRTDSGKPSRRLLKILCTTQDHTGGHVAFGPDGYLYLGMGDTGPQQDPQGHGQDMTTLLGKILCIDVNHWTPHVPYAIPAENPFADKLGIRQEIFALGFREPWRFSFDTLTGDLWVGDVGQDRVEEVAIVRKGENHGWNVYEGFEPFSNKYRKENTTYTAPVFAYRRKFGNSITGGFVYRGDKDSPFYGAYICGDYTSKKIFAVRQKDRVLQSVRQIGTSPQFISSFGTDEAGSIYVVGYEGMVYKIDFTTADGS